MSRRLKETELLLNERKTAKQNYTVFGSKADEIKKSMNVNYGNQTLEFREELSTINSRLYELFDSIVSNVIVKEEMDEYIELQNRRLELLNEAIKNN